jgi:hypothetical protein
LRNILKKGSKFFYTKMPPISLAGMLLSWLIYLIAPRNGGIDDLTGSYWSIMNCCIWLFVICGCVFILSFISYMFLRPLPQKRRMLSTVIRVILSVFVLIISLGACWISVFIFSGAGF